MFFFYCFGFVSDLHVLVEIVPDDAIASCTATSPVAGGRRNTRAITIIHSFVILHSHRRKLRTIHKDNYQNLRSFGKGVGLLWLTQ